MTTVSKHREPILLLNCRQCDDIQRLHEEMPRTCLCGKSAGRFTLAGFVCSGPARILEISIEEYDGAGPGENRRWRVRP